MHPELKKITIIILFRFPSRLRTRPTPSTTSQPELPIEEENTEPIFRRRFRPKEPRHSSTTESSERISLSDSQDKYPNTRLRPINRKSSDLKPKVAIRPNLFSVKRRPPITIRNKNKTSEDVTTTETIDTTIIPKETSDIEKIINTSETITEYQSMEIPKTNLSDDNEESTTEMLTEDDYSKRVSDLTSSFQNEYENPGFFKSVPSNSRRIPNHFTISTDDPILPIEAFFPNLKDKE